MMVDPTIAETYLSQFQADYQDALGYHRRAEKFSQTKRPANLVFNIASMALEQYLVALCDLYCVTPENHDYGCLMSAVETVMDFPAGWNQDIRALDEVFGLCSLEVNPHGDPKAADAKRILVLCGLVRDFLTATIQSGVEIKASA
jgi:hypothetical protein